MTPSDLAHNHFLLHLRLSDCRIDTQPTLEPPNLRHLDLSTNELTHIDINQFHSLTNLRVLVLFGNPLSTIANTEPSRKGTLILHTISISGASFHVFNGSALAGCPLLKTLNISWSRLTTISEGGFQSTPLFENLDVRGSPLKDFNSALNPFLYTFNVLMEKRQKAQEAYLLKRLASRMHTERTQADTSLKIPLPVNRSTAVDLVKGWLSEQVLTPGDIVSCSGAICDGEKRELWQ